MDLSATDRCGFFSDQPDSRAIAAHEDDLGSSPHELDRSGSPDAASGSREHNDRHTADLTLRPDTGSSDHVPAERGDSRASLRLAAVVSPAFEETDAVRRVYEREAANYDRNVKLPERLLFAGGREWVCAQAEGDVLEIAVGTGLNLPHYPDGVRLTGIEFVPAMLDIARRRAVELGRPVELRLGDAQALEFEDATFDTVLCTLSLCTIPDDRAVVAEARRVLRPGGRFVLLEHVRSPIRAVRAAQRLLAPAFVRFGADHVLREPLEHMQAEGFTIELLQRSKLGLVERLIVRKPGSR